MVIEKIVLEGITKDIATCDKLSYLDILIRVEFPGLNDIERWDFNTLWDEAVGAIFSDLLKWTLDTVENVG